MPLNEDDEEHLKEMNEQERRFRESAYFPVQNIGIVLLEIFALDQREELAKGLQWIFESTEPMALEDLRHKGILARGWSQRKVASTLF